MRRGSAIFEVFPYKYWKEGYRPFANEYGLWHGWSQNKRATTWYRNFVLSFISQVECGEGMRARKMAGKRQPPPPFGASPFLGALYAVS